MSFAHEGFFSPEIEDFRANVRNLGDTKLWFDFALDLNRIGFDLLRDAETSRADNARLAMHGLFVRGHQSFQSVLVLAERGLVGDARTVIRSGVESAIAIHALADDKTFVQQLVNAHYLNQRKLARVLLQNSAYLASYDASQIAAMKAAVAQVDALETAEGSKFKDINWADTAIAHCPDLYQLMYRSFSNDGTHTSLNSLDRYFVADENAQITSFRVAPDGEGLIEVLSAACVLFMWLAEPIASVFGRADVSDAIKTQLARYKTLPGAFPGKSPLQAAE